MSVAAWTAPSVVKSVGWWRAFLAGIGLCVAMWLVDVALGSPGGAGAWTVGYGVAAAALLVVALAYAARRRMPGRGPGASYHWLQGHVYGSCLFLLLLVLHTGARAPDGALGWGLWSGGWWVVLTGLAGVGFQKWIPRALSSGLSTEVHYDRIPELVDHVRGRADALVAEADESVQAFHRSTLAPILAAPRARWIYVVDITGGIQARMRQFDYLQQFLGDADRRRVEDLRTLTRTKLEMDAQYTLQRVLRGWLYLHVPIAVALTLLVAFHVFAVWYY